MNKTRRNRRKKAKNLKVNRAKRLMIRCSTTVDRNAVRRETVDGIEHITISSKTLPDDIVMNGILYPATEVDSSYQSLERTLAPVEHPTDSQGNYISANDPIAIHNFHAGAYNENVRRQDGRVHIDKVINVAEAKKTEKGRRLLDRVEELENSNDPRPIHTSVGVFIELEELDEMATNAMGQEYQLIARNMVFDHDAILLDSVGAAQPNQGVGMAVNGEGEKIESKSITVGEDLVTVPTDGIEEISHEELREKLFDALNTAPLTADYVVRVYDSRVIYSLDEQVFSVPYEIGNGVVTIAGIPLPVQREENFVPKTNNSKGDEMRELMINALKAAGVTVNGNETDEELMKLHSALHANQDADDSDENADENADGEDEAGDEDANDAEPSTKEVVNALNAVNNRLESMEKKLNKQTNDEIGELAKVIVNSGKYPGLDDEAIKKLPLKNVKSMAANCGTAFGIPHLQAVNSGGQGGSDIVPSDMPN